MKRFEELNPWALFVYYLSVIVITMFSMDPLLITVSLVSSVLCCIRVCDRRAHLFALAVFVFAALLNPIFVHKGATVLFYVNDRPFTLEATVYGLVAAAMIAAALYRLRGMSAAFTSDKVLYLFGRVSPKLALMLSMSIRYVGLFRIRFRKIQDTQRALGLYDDGNLIDAVRGRARVLSVLITWTLENGIITAESMESRGYGSSRRSSYAVYRIHTADIAVILLCVILDAVTVIGAINTKIDYYPKLGFELFTPWGIAGAAAFALLCFLPVIINVKEAVRWRSLISEV